MKITRVINSTCYEEGRYSYDTCLENETYEDTSAEVTMDNLRDYFEADKDNYQSEYESNNTDYEVTVKTYADINEDADINNLKPACEITVWLSVLFNQYND